MRLGLKAIVHFGSQIVLSVAGFAATFAILNLGSTTLLGQYSTAIAIGYFGLVFPAVAVNSGVKKRISEGTDQGAFFGAGILINAVVAALAVCSVGALVALLEALGPTVTVAGQSLRIGETVLATILSENWGLLAALGVAAVAYWTALAGLEGRQHVGTAGILEAAERSSRTGVQAGALLAGYGLGALLLGPVVSLFAIAIVGLVLVDIRPRLPDRSHVRSIVSYVRYAWLGTLQSRVYGWMDTLVLSLFVGASLIGIYEAAWGVASLLSVFSVSVKRTLFPAVSEVATSGDLDRVRHFLDESLVFAGLVVIPGFVGTVVIGGRILRFYDPAIDQGAGIMTILVFGAVVDVYAAQFLNVVNAIDRPEIAYRVNAAFIGLNVVLNLVLVSQYGWYGAAVATAAAASLRLVLGYRGARGALETVPFPVAELGRQALAAALMTIAVVPLNRLTPQGRPWTLLLVGAGAAVYFAALLVLSGRVRGKVRSVLPVAIPDSRGL